ncbi:potassium channel family protein [Psychroflexus sp. ALD_RP9]|uniref:potassium channel family protein n=1 Tax=Psychroflexus sp. ALD_RP9 TaxID=2777186 RepID=UPI001A8D5759|nr:potassium channel family protein [Psychroflexus sp. ALD_RP9]QSS97243.1 potassium channel family protein [Psychroflexus sp. ALD_RP9]
MLSVNKLIVAALSLFSIALLTMTFFLPEESEVNKLLHYYDFGLCIVFFYDFLKQFINSDQKLKYFFTYGWLDLLSSIPVIAEFRYVRIFRIFRVLRIIQSFRMLVKFIRSNRVASLYGLIIFMAVTIMIITSTLVLYFEKDSGNIKTAEDALWWSYVTITTVGYGDFYPVTSIGKLLSGILILTGIASFGAVISYITGRVDTIKAKGKHH